MENRRLVLGVTGGVAAYKAAYLARRLLETGSEIRVIMTEGAQHFVGAQTFAAISGHPVATDLFAPNSVSLHTEMAAWADGVVVAPTTASLMSRLATGFTDSLLPAFLVACDVPVLLAPAMHTEMWNHPATQRNLRTLQSDGYQIIMPTSGGLAGGDDGIGRMAEPDDIVSALEEMFIKPLDGWKVLVSAGGTREPIDPVRYVGNRSSGKMGTAIAASAAAMGADTTLVTAASLPVPSNVTVIHVNTADEMAQVIWQLAPTVDVAVLAAAVADFRPKNEVDSKIRRSDGIPEIKLEPTPDILAGVVQSDSRPFVVGFAAETGGIDGARRKAVEKGVDLLVANDVSAAGSGFGSDTNRVTLIQPDGTEEAWELMPKEQVADRLWVEIATQRS